jgi:hypothetical protein
MIRDDSDESIRFGGHVYIQVSYKILWLEDLEKALGNGTVGVSLFGRTN